MATAYGSNYQVVELPNGDFLIITDEIAASDVVRFDYEDAVSVTAALTGTLADGATEAQIVTGGETLIITLTGDTWVATVGDDNAITDALIDGIDSAQAEAAGWDAEVKGNLVFGDVTRTSDTIVTITLQAEAAYSITSNETITVTIPATAVTLAAEIVATPTFQITATPSGLVIPIVAYYHRKHRN